MDYESIFKNKPEKKSQKKEQIEIKEQEDTSNDKGTNEEEGIRKDVIDDIPFTQVSLHSGKGVSVEDKEEEPKPKAKAKGGYDLIGSQDEDLYEVETNHAQKKYEELNHKMVGEATKLLRGYPKLLLYLNGKDTLNQRQLSTIQHFIIQDSRTEEEIEQRGLLRFEINMKIAGKISNKLIGYIAPESLLLIYTVLKDKKLKGFYKENVELQGLQILALSKQQQG